MRRVSSPTVLIMAAGQGTRMQSAVPKVLHPVCGRALVAWPIAAAREAGAGADRRDRLARPRHLRCVARRHRDDPAAGGRTAPAAPSGAAPTSSRDSETVIVLSGDVPAGLRRVDRRLCSRPTRDAGAAATVVTAVLDDPGTYGRVVRDRRRRGREDRRGQGRAGDATAEELAIREINAGIYAFDGRAARRRAAEPRQRQRPGRVLPPRRPAAARARRAATSPPTSPPTRT